MIHGISESQVGLSGCGYDTKASEELFSNEVIFVLIQRSKLYVDYVTTRKKR